MALTYQSFLNFPLQIEGVTMANNAKIAAIEAFIIEDMAYNGPVGDLDPVLPYFGFFYYIQNDSTTATNKAGEQRQSAEFTEAAINKQVFNWNTGASKLRTICGVTPELLSQRTELFEADRIHAILVDLGVSINENYLSKISWL